jgi:hypothetical protein
VSIGQIPGGRLLVLRRIVPLGGAAALFGLLVFLYPAKPGSFFTGEDTLTLMATSRLDQPGALSRVLTQPLMAGSTFLTRGEFFRPVTALVHGAEFAVIGLHPRPYHLLDLAWHAAVAWLLALAVWRLSQSGVAAAAAGVLFVMHPVLLEVVPPTSRRQEAIWTAFTLGAWLLSRRPDRSAWSAGGRRLAAAACTALAVGSKATGIVTPALIAADAWLIPGGRPIRERLAATWRAAWPHAGAAAAMLAWHTMVLGGAGGYVVSPDEPASSMVTRALQLGRYAADLTGLAGLGRIAPVPLLPGALVACAGLAALGYAVARRGTLAGAIGVLWAAAWLPAMAAAATGSHSPRYAYAGAAFFAAVVVMTFTAAATSRTRAGRRLAAGGLVALLAALALAAPRTRAASREWAANADLARTVLTQVEHGVRAHPAATRVELRCAPVVVASPTSRVRTAGQIADHTVASWLALARPARPVVIRVASRQRLMAWPVALSATWTVPEAGLAIAEFGGCEGRR